MSQIISLQTTQRLFTDLRPHYLHTPQYRPLIFTDRISLPSGRPPAHPLSPPLSLPSLYKLPMYLPFLYRPHVLPAEQTYYHGHCTLAHCRTFVQLARVDQWSSALRVVAYTGIWAWLLPCDATTVRTVFSCQRNAEGRQRVLEVASEAWARSVYK